MSKPFSEQLKTARAKAGLTPREFADAAGVSRSTVWNWETGAIEPAPLHQSGILDWLAKQAVQNDDRK